MNGSKDPRVSFSTASPFPGSPVTLTAPRHASTQNLYDWSRVRLGVGATGAVFLGRCRFTGALVAVKRKYGALEHAGSDNNNNNGANSGSGSGGCVDASSSSSGCGPNSTRAGGSDRLSEGGPSGSVVEPASTVRDVFGANEAAEGASSCNGGGGDAYFVRKEGEEEVAAPRLLSRCMEEGWIMQYVGPHPCVVPLFAHIDIPVETRDSSSPKVLLANAVARTTTAASANSLGATHNEDEMLRTRVVAQPKQNERPDTFPCFPSSSSAAPSSSPRTISSFVVMELMDTDLGNEIKRGNTEIMDERIIMHLAFRIVSALHHLHSHGVAHRDVKPSNILLKNVPCDVVYVEPQQRERACKGSVPKTSTAQRTTQTAATTTNESKQRSSVSLSSFSPQSPADMSGILVSQKLKGRSSSSSRGSSGIATHRKTDLECRGNTSATVAEEDNADVSRSSINRSMDSNNNDDDDDELEEQPNDCDGGDAMGNTSLNNSNNSNSHHHHQHQVHNTSTSSRKAANTSCVSFASDVPNDASTSGADRYAKRRRDQKHQEQQQQGGHQGEMQRVTSTVKVCLGDFGSAHFVPGSAPSWVSTISRVTDESVLAVRGTLYYKPPEQLMGKLAASTGCSVDYFASDMWALGCTLYEVAAGAVAFCGSSDLQVLNQIYARLGSDYQTFPSQCRAVTLFESLIHPSRTFVDFLSRLLALDPRERLTVEEALRHPFFHPITLLPSASASSVFSNRVPSSASAARPAFPSSPLEPSSPTYATPYTSGIVALSKIKLKGAKRIDSASYKFRPLVTQQERVPGSLPPTRQNEFDVLFRSPRGAVGEGNDFNCGRHLCGPSSAGTFLPGIQSMHARVPSGDEAEPGERAALTPTACELAKDHFQRMFAPQCVPMMSVAAAATSNANANEMMMNSNNNIQNHDTSGFMNSSFNSMNNSSIILPSNASNAATTVERPSRPTHHQSALMRSAYRSPNASSHKHRLHLPHGGNGSGSGCGGKSLVRYMQSANDTVAGGTSGHSDQQQQQSAGLQGITIRERSRIVLSQRALHEERHQQQQHRLMQWCYAQHSPAHASPSISPDAFGSTARNLNRRLEGSGSSSRSNQEEHRVMRGGGADDGSINPANDSVNGCEPASRRGSGSHEPLHRAVGRLSYGSAVKPIRFDDDDGDDEDDGNGGDYELPSGGAVRVSEECGEHPSSITALQVTGAEGTEEDSSAQPARAMRADTIVFVNQPPQQADEHVESDTRTASGLSKGPHRVPTSSDSSRSSSSDRCTSLNSSSSVAHLRSTRQVLFGDSPVATPYNAMRTHSPVACSTMTTSGSSNIAARGESALPMLPSSSSSPSHLPPSSSVTAAVPIVSIGKAKECASPASIPSSSSSSPHRKLNGYRAITLMNHRTNKEYMRSTETYYRFMETRGSAPCAQQTQNEEWRENEQAGVNDDGATDYRDQDEQRLNVSSSTSHDRPRTSIVASESNETRKTSIGAAILSTVNDAMPPLSVSAVDRRIREQQQEEEEENEVEEEKVDQEQEKEEEVRKQHILMTPLSALRCPASFFGSPSHPTHGESPVSISSFVPCVESKMLERVEGLKVESSRPTQSSLPAISAKIPVERARPAMTSSNSYSSSCSSVASLPAICSLEASAMAQLRRSDSDASRLDHVGGQTVQPIALQPPPPPPPPPAKRNGTAFPRSNSSSLSSGHFFPNASGKNASSGNTSCEGSPLVYSQRGQTHEPSTFNCSSGQYPDEPDSSEYGKSFPRRRTISPLLEPQQEKKLQEVQESQEASRVDRGLPPLGAGKNNSSDSAGAGNDGRENVSQVTSTPSSSSNSSTIPIRSSAAFSNAVKLPSTAAAVGVGVATGHEQQLQRRRGLTEVSITSATPTRRLLLLGNETPGNVAAASAAEFPWSSASTSQCTKNTGNAATPRRSLSSHAMLSESVVYSGNKRSRQDLQMETHTETLYVGCWESNSLASRNGGSQSRSVPSAMEVDAQENSNNVGVEGDPSILRGGASQSVDENTTSTPMSRGSSSSISRTSGGGRGRGRGVVPTGILRGIHVNEMPSMRKPNALPSMDNSRKKENER